MPFCFPRVLPAYSRAMIDKAVKYTVYTCEQTNMYMQTILFQIADSNFEE